MTIPVKGETIISASEANDEEIGERVTELGVQAVELWAEKSRSISLIPGSCVSSCLIRARFLINSNETIRYGFGFAGGYIFDRVCS